MARLFTIGYETRWPHRVEHPMLSQNGTVDIDTTNHWDGSACAKLSHGGESVIENTIAHGTSTYWQLALRVDTDDTDILLAAVFAAGEDWTWELLKDSSGEVFLRNQKTGSIVYSTGFVPAPGTYYLYETRTKTAASGNGELDLRIRSCVDGAVLFEGTNPSVDLVNAEPWVWSACNLNAEAVWCSHQIMNDSNGSFENGWPGLQKVVMLKPKFDDTVTGFTGADGGTTNLYDAVNNYPSLGRANNSANDTNLTQIRSVSNNSTDFYECGTFAYSDPVAEGGGGLADGDVIRCVMALARGGNSTTTSRNMALKVGSNPFIAEVTKGTGTTAAATEPTGWTTINTGYDYNPTLEEAPLDEGCWPIVRKGTASSNALMYDMIGVYVSYVPAPPSSPGPRFGSRNLVGVGR